MSRPDFDGASAYILERMRRDLPSDLYYHDMRHTTDDVVPAVERLAAMEGINTDWLMLLKTAALYHDSGYIEQYADNEPIGVRLASESLFMFGFAADQIQTISEIIMATQMPQRPADLLQSIMCDADLDSLGREDFFLVGHHLRLELAAHGDPTTLREWYERQLVFLKEHTYTTNSARALRGPGKEKNIAQLEELLHPARA